MVSREELIGEVEPAVCRIVALDASANEIGWGSGFLTDHGLITAHHVLPTETYDTAKIEFGGGLNLVLARADVQSRTSHESLESAWDYRLISVEGLEIPSQHIHIVPSPLPPRGREVLYLGYPFGTTTLTASVGYVSAVETDSIDLIRIDGSVNRGNSGGPVIDLTSRSLIGVIIRAETGYLEQQFDQLHTALIANIKALESQQGGARIVIGGLDPVDAIRASQAALLQLAEAIRKLMSESATRLHFAILLSISNDYGHF